MLPVSYVRQLVTDVSPWRSEFDPRAVHVEYMVERMTLVQVFLCIFSLLLLFTFDLSSTFIYPSSGADVGPLAASVLGTHPIPRIKDSNKLCFKLLLRMG